MVVTCPIGVDHRAVPVFQHRCGPLRLKQHSYSKRFTLWQWIFDHIFVTNEKRLTPWPVPSIIRSMARPRKGQEKDRPHQIGFRASDVVRKALTKEAKTTKRSVSDVLNQLVEKQLITKGLSRE